MSSGPLSRSQQKEEQEQQDVPLLTEAPAPCNAQWPPRIRRQGSHGCNLQQAHHQVCNCAAACGKTFKVPGNELQEDGEEEKEHSGNRVVRIPSFSPEDRRKRTVVGAPIWWVALRSNLLVASLFFGVYVIPYTFQRVHCSGTEVCIIIAFIVLHTVTTLFKSVPDESSTVEELNKRTNATTFVAMVLYPCIAIWIRERSESHNGFTNLFEIRHEGRYQWGSVFPFFMWGMSALILVRDSYHCVAVDQSYVIGDKEGRSAIGLFRRYPNPLEAITYYVGFVLTISPWDLLGSGQRPAGGAGRFAFQLMSPVVLLFFYIGMRFMLFSAQEAYHQAKCWPSVCLDDWRGSNFDKHLAFSRFHIWLAFTIYCCLIRGLVPSSLFLRLTVPDPESRKWLLPRWREGTVESKRMRVLWAFRGLASTFVPWYYAARQELPDEANSVWDVLLWYLYVGVYVSFFMEGLGALFFALHEAEHGCCMHTPFGFLMSECFWGAFNILLQPLGTAVNLLFCLINQEHNTKVKLKEVFGPAIDSRGDYRCRLRRVPPVAVTEEDLEDWIETWKRKRASVGKSTDTLDVVAPKGELPERGSMPVVFHGTVFPTYAERHRMMDDPHQHIPVKPWEHDQVAEKFHRWYPTCVQEVQRLLREPYNFQRQREVWVWGYGSLMSPDSPPAGLSERQRKLMLPYWVKKEAGYRRCWNYRHGSVGINALGLLEVGPEQGGGEDICGLAYPMDYELASDLFSKREDGYRLLLLHESYLEPMHPRYPMPAGCGYVWIVGQPITKCHGPDVSECYDYTCKLHWPTDDSPILQSYVDEIISGALRYKTVVGKNDGMNFAAALIKSMHGWSRPWLNDRILSGRPWKFLPDYELIDGLLNTCPVSHNGFVRRYRPSLCPSPVLGGLFHQRYETVTDWRAGLFGGDCREEEDQS